MESDAILATSEHFSFRGGFNLFSTCQNPVPLLAEKAFNGHEPSNVSTYTAFEKKQAFRFPKELCHSEVKPAMKY